MVHAWPVKGKRLGMLMDVQASWHDSTTYVWRFFPLKWKSRQLWHHQMMSLSFCLCKWRGVYKEMCMSPTVLLLVLHLWFVLQLIHPGSHRHSVSATLVPLKEWNYHHTGKFFICSSIYAQGYLEHPALVCFSCLWVSQVACHPASIWPGTGKARTASLWSWVAHVG